MTADTVFVLAFALGMPLIGLIRFRRLKRKVASGSLAARQRSYRQIIGVQASVALAALVLWALAGRPWPALGLGGITGRGFWLALALGAGVVGLLAAQLRAVGRKPALREQVREAVRPLAPFLPHAPEEFAWFAGLSVMAGFAEELLYRGYLVWYFGELAGLWPAILVSSALFGAGHAYQGVGGVLKTAAVGLAMAGLYVLSGSLWIPMAIHALIDLLQGRTLFLALSEASPAEMSPA